jgi:hypothetical protein
MKKLLVILAAVSLILTAGSGLVLANGEHPPYACGMIDKVVHSPYGYDIVFKTTGCGKCVMIKMIDGRKMEWKYCQEDHTNWRDIPKKDQ